MKTYEFVIIQKTSVRVALTPEQVEAIEEGTLDGSNLLERLAEHAGRPGIAHLGYDLDHTPLREVKP